jgi:hypothetical protein
LVKIKKGGEGLPSQAGDTVDRHAASRFFTKLHLQEVQPIINDLARGRSSIIERPILEKH